MAHTYVVTSAVDSGNDICTITGTVDQIPVTITPWLSAINKLANVTAVQNFIAPLMLAAALQVPNNNIVGIPPTSLPNVTSAGTFSQ